MSLASLDDNLQTVGRRHETAGAVVEGAFRHRPGVQAKDGFGSVRRVEYTLADHQLRTTFLVGWRTLLGRLEYEFDGARNEVAVRRQNFGCAHEHGDMRVMAAGVHHVDFLAVVLTFGL